MCELRKFRKAANYSPWVVFVEETQKLETRSENSSASDAPELAAAGLFRFGCWACKAYEAQPLQVGRGGHSSTIPNPTPQSRNLVNPWTNGKIGAALRKRAVPKLRVPTTAQHWDSIKFGSCGLRAQSVRGGVWVAVDLRAKASSERFGPKRQPDCQPSRRLIPH